MRLHQDLSGCVLVKLTKFRQRMTSASWANVLRPYAEEVKEYEPGQTSCDHSRNSYWRKNKLLPEQYCDFLLNLYGGAETEISATGRANKSILNNSKGLAWSLGLGLISIISILVINFNAFPLQLQIAVAIIGVLI